MLERDQGLLLQSANLYAANGAGVVFAEKGNLILQRIFSHYTQVQEAASGSINVQMPDVWINYFKQGKIEQFKQLLEEGSSPEIDEYYADVRYERIAILHALGAYYNYLGKIETKHIEKDYSIQATKYYNKASRICKGHLLLAKGEIEQAFNALY